MIGAFVVIVAFASLVGSIIVGGIIGLICFLAARKHFSPGRHIKIWASGVVSAALFWAAYIMITVEMGPVGGPPTKDALGAFVKGSALWAALPGICLLGGGCSHIVGLIFLKKEIQPPEIPDKNR